MKQVQDFLESISGEEGLYPYMANGRPFVPGKSSVYYSGPYWDNKEIESIFNCFLKGKWLASGEEVEKFERLFSKKFKFGHSLMVNSGSSANLLAITSLTSHKIPREKRLLPGDEVITCAAGFPTTVAPILQNGAVPVFLDNDPQTSNADLRLLQEAYVPGKTKAVMLAHALGNPFDLSRIQDFCIEHDIWLIEDNCDALGSVYSMADSSGLIHRLLFWGGSAPRPPRQPTCMHWRTIFSIFDL